MRRARRRPAMGAAAARGVAGLMAFALAACGAPEARGTDEGAGDRTGPGAESGGAAMADAQQDWIVLFDGTDLSAWRGYGRPDVPRGWQVRDGLLTFVPGQEGGDLITRDRFGDFELVLEWRVGTAGNSGIFYRAPEGFERIWHGAPEMQVLDDAGHVDGRTPATSAGALYALYPPTADVVRPAGEWNAVRVVADGPRVEHWLNGERIVAYEAGSPEWEARVAASKFSEWPEFGRAERGHIGLQDHGDTVWFRDIRVRPIAPGR